MSKTICFVLTLLLSLQLLGQEEATETRVKDLPVKEPFLSGMLLDNQTTFIPVEKTFEYVIQHKFGPVDNGISDIFGLYAAGSFIRLGVNYVPITNLQISYGLNRLRMYNDFAVKYTLLEQTRKNKVPFAVTLYSNMALDARHSNNFGINYRFSNRFSYFSQLIISRKFNDYVSVQAHASFTHYNKTEPGIDHDKIGVGINGKISINYKSAILFQYDMPLKVEKITEHREFINPPQPNIGLGWEIRTSAHVFHLYVSTTESFVPQHNTLYNQLQWLKGQVRFGFTITRLYNFS
ncbi:MAG: hypothetical protein JXR22_04775 [Prolixibacteraceae bacterium]|nr:hypothetical protein [Prolixibacteraceae bacterium]